MTESLDLTILLVEDDDVAAEAVMRGLKRCGVTVPVVWAEDGEVALRVLRGADPLRLAPRPRVVMLDLNMPRFSPRIRYEASTVHGVLDLVGAGLGVALVPVSTALLQVAGVRLKRLRRTQVGEVLALLRRKNDPQQMHAELETNVASIFDSMQQRIAALVGP
jgi:CheY-like chemotaxis protein